MLDQMKKYFKVGVVYTSNTLEDFSYTGTETKILIEDGLTAEGKSLRDAMAVFGHGEAYDYMFDIMKKPYVEENDIIVFHSFLKGSLDNSSVPGKYRDTITFINGSDGMFPHWEIVPELMRKMFKIHHTEFGSVHPVLSAAWLHRQLAFIKPFADGNGRVARLAMNAVFIHNGYPPVMIPHYYRSHYIDSLKKARLNNSAFFHFIAECQDETLTELLRLIAPNKEEIDFGFHSGSEDSGKLEPHSSAGKKRSLFSIIGE
jgi:Fic family protein